MAEELFTVAQTAEYLQIHPNSVYELAKANKIPHYRIEGVGIRFKKEELDNWLEESLYKPSKVAEHLPIKKQKLDIPLEDYLEGNLEGDSALAQKRGRWNFGRKGVYRRWLKKGYSWYYWYYENGKRKRESAPGATCLEDAIIVMEAKVREVFNKKHGIKNQSITFKEFAPIYLEKYAIPNKRSSYRDQRFLKAQLIPFFGEMRLSEITPEQVSDFVAKRKQDGVKGSTVNKHLQVLSRMMNLAEEFGYEVGKNPVRRKIHFADESKYRRTRVLSYEEDAPLMKEAAQHLRPIIQCALLQGMREQEILQLKVTDVDIKADSITIRPEINKTGKLDIIPIRDEMKSILKKLIADNAGRSPYVFNYYDPRYNKYRPIRSIQHAFQAACRRAGIEGLQFRDLRRTCSTRLHEAGVDPLLISRLLRHSSTKISAEVYIQSSLKLMKEALKKADEKVEKEAEMPIDLTHHWHTGQKEKKGTPTISLFSVN